MYVKLLLSPLVRGSDGMAKFKVGFDARRHVPTNTGVWDFRQKLAGLLREQSLQAFNYLVETLNNEKAHPKLRKECAVEILNRGLGAPVNQILIEQVDKGSDQDIDVTELTTAELELLLRKYQDEELEVKAINITLPNKH